MKKAFLTLLLVLASSLIGIQALAQDGDRDDDSDRQSSAMPAPRETVGRISMIHGDVSVQRGDSGDWVASTLNTPIVRGDRVATSDRSRTEVQLDYADILRLSSNSQAKIADLSRTRIQIQMSQGYANFSQFKGSEADVEIDTPNVAVHPLRHGRYRIQVNSDSETDVIVREGEVEVTTPQGGTTVKEGQLMTIRGTDNPEYKVVEAPGSDDWDHWNKDRDKLIRNAESWHKTNQYYTGAHDLDAYGHWVDVPGYGDVWSPYNVDAGWAPYQAGRWVWEPYYGWTWVSYEPWGWAPYHYGRWFFYGSSWFWWPGPVGPFFRPVWSPAFVVFFGFGHRSNFGFGFGSVGWLPCGPRDFFFPWWGRGFNRFNTVNVTNINVTNINVTNININRSGGVAPLALHGRPAMSNVNLAMTNARVRQAITTVRAEDFGRGVGSSARVHVDAATFKQGQAMTGNLGVVPTRDNLRFTNKNAAPPAGVRGGANERFFSRTSPPQSGPSFQQQQNQVQEVIRAHGGGAQATVNTRTGATASGGGIQGPNVGPGSGRTAGGGKSGQENVRSMSPATGQPGNQAPPVSGRSNNDAAAGHNGWSRFGDRNSSPNDSRGQREFHGAPSTNSVPSSSAGSTSGRNTAPVVTPSNNGSSRDGWQRFPTGSPQGHSTSSGQGRTTEMERPPLNLNRPIVTQRTNDNGPRTMSPPPSRVERNSAPPPPSRMERSSPPPRSEMPRSAPSPRYSGGGGGGDRHSSGGSSRSSGGSSRSSGGSSRGGDSKSSSHDHHH